ncbi:MBL fold metallo-hydrolase [uncultured Vibrio sp.]|uniref:MBL fold metallo-hydrolase n=1 Tax=uncultured Vibrio sp. TaxID=114054 RepID=UPI000913C971|nr:MBL fold metallo-hydrolase [uncultured Vibrio sp.]OIQ26574.1 MAG: hydrolase [Vibrio sp. MedPE-SWchi]
MPAHLSQSMKTLLLNNESKPDRFSNTETLYQPTLKEKITTIRSYLNIDKLLNFQPPCIPILAIDNQEFEHTTEDCLYRLGHSSVLMKLDGKVMLTDPVLSERASPLDWAGPKRYHPLPITMDALPDIDICLISHDHYDHLDKETIQRIHHKVSRFYVPTNVRKYLLEWGVPDNKITEFGWWQSRINNDINFTFTPTQHFSGRSFKERDTSLWGSWVIKSAQSNLFFSGDSGYFSGFKEIGEKYGPFDLTLMETGAYDDNWSDIHMFPEQSVQAHIDVNGRFMLPIHNTTFDLSYHVWNEPLKRAHAEASRRHVDIVCPKIGERIVISQLGKSPKPAVWWD